MDHLRGKRPCGHPRPRRRQLGDHVLGGRRLRIRGDANGRHANGPLFFPVGQFFIHVGKACLDFLLFLAAADELVVDFFNPAPYLVLGCRVVRTGLDKPCQGGIISRSSFLPKRAPMPVGPKSLWPEKA